MILGEEEAGISTYFNDDEPESAKKNAFSRVRIILSNLLPLIQQRKRCHTYRYARQNLILDAASFMVDHAAGQFHPAVYGAGMHNDCVGFRVRQVFFIHAVIRRIFAKRGEIARLLSFQLNTQSHLSYTRMT